MWLICWVRGHLEPELVSRGTDLVWLCLRCGQRVKPPESFEEQDLEHQIFVANKELEAVIREIADGQNKSEEETVAFRQTCYDMVRLLARDVALERHNPDEPARIAALTANIRVLRGMPEVLKKL